MKFLKIFLIAVFVILILLLFLLRDCSRPRHHHPEEPDGPEPIERPEPVEPTDSTDEEITERYNSGLLQFTLIYDFYGDIDLHVITPGGVDINFENTRDPRSTGELDHDERNGGPRSAENIYFSNPPAGTYRVYLYYYSEDFMERNRRNESYMCRLVVNKQGEEPVTYNVPMRVPREQSDYIEVTMP